MTQTTTKPTTQTTGGRAGALHADPRVAQALDALAASVADARATINDVRPADASRRTQFEDLLDSAANVRGRPLLYPYIGSGLGAGPLVELADGSVKFDMIEGIGVHFFGHSDGDLVRTAVEAALADTVMQGHLQMNAEAITFGRTLVDQAAKSSKLAHAFLCCSGAMANENALKVCMQKHHPADRVLAFSHCFMGRSTTMSQIGDSAAGRVGLPVWAHVDYVPFYDADLARREGQDAAIKKSVADLEAHIQRYPGRHACFVFELVQGEGGFNQAPADFHKALMEVCKENSIAVSVDEIQTFGRTMRMFCFDALGLGDYVDVVTIGKMSQVCAALFTDDYNPKPGLLSGTFLGSTVGLRVGKRIIERLRDGEYYGDNGAIARHHDIFREHVHALAKKHPDWFPVTAKAPDIVGGFGGMMRFTPFGGDKQAILSLCKTMFEQGVIAFYCGHGPFHVRFLPPLGVMQEADWPRVFAIVESSLAKVAQTK